MKTIFRFLLILSLSLATLLSMGACHTSGNFNRLFGDQATLRGNGNIVSKTIAAPDYTSVKASRAVKVVIGSGPQGQITVQADENVMPYVVLTCKNGVLEATIDPVIQSFEHLSVEVMLPATERIGLLSASASGTIEARGLAVTDKLALKVNSAGKIEGDLSAPYIGIEASSAAKVKANVATEQLFVGASSAARVELTGTATAIEANISSSARLDAEELLSETGTIQASAAAKATVHCTTRLSANASAAGRIRNVCRPEYVETSTSAAGSVDLGR